ncbi:MAG: type II toxin-antitoxin system RelE/ParE family toxin [Nostoc sp.]|uniref:type II toxin-antitoxin system RelE/ParE family toxin n=1 Tax=Nostoc sp. TaxID=1180 RepID=UPI002FFCEEE0
MGRFIRTAKTEEDLIEIWIYIAADNPTASDRLLYQIDTKCQMLADNPERGQARPDIAPGLRYFSVGRYLIFYQNISKGIEIVRVVHGAKYLPGIIY